MNSKDVGLLIAGVIAGHLLASYLRMKRETAKDTTSLPNTSSQTLPPDTVGQETLVDPRLTLCEENWANYSKTKRFGSEEQLNATKNNFITNCLARIQ